MRKPHREIYELMLNRYGINPAQAVFIDDSIKNVKGCEEVGITGIHFTNAERLQASLSELGLKF